MGEFLLGKGSLLALVHISQAHYVVAAFVYLHLCERRCRRASPYLGARCPVLPLPNTSVGHPHRDTSFEISHRYTSPEHPNHNTSSGGSPHCSASRPRRGGFEVSTPPTCFFRRGALLHP